MFLRRYPAVISDANTKYTVLICGEERADGTWEGWIEFHSDSGTVLCTDRETTQPNRMDLAYWADGLEPVYIEGAFTRAQDRVEKAS